MTEPTPTDLPTEPGWYQARWKDHHQARYPVEAQSFVEVVCFDHDRTVVGRSVHLRYEFDLLVPAGELVVALRSAPGAPRYATLSHFDWFGPAAVEVRNLGVTPGHEGEPRAQWPLKSAIVGAEARLAFAPEAVTLRPPDAPPLTGWHEAFGSRMTITVADHAIVARAIGAEDIVLEVNDHGTGTQALYRCRPMSSRRHESDTTIHLMITGWLPLLQPVKGAKP